MVWICPIQENSDNLKGDQIERIDHAFIGNFDLDKKAQD
jgi:hypothetical protein